MLDTLTDRSSLPFAHGLVTDSAKSSLAFTPLPSLCKYLAGCPKQVPCIWSVQSVRCLHSDYIVSFTATPMVPSTFPFLDKFLLREVFRSLVWFLFA